MATRFTARVRAAGIAAAPRSGISHHRVKVTPGFWGAIIERGAVRKTCSDPARDAKTLAATTSFNGSDMMFRRSLGIGLAAMLSAGLIGYAAADSRPAAKDVTVTNDLS